MTLKRSFSYVLKRNFLATNFASKRVFIITVSLQPWFILSFLQKEPQEVFSKNRHEVCNFIKIETLAQVFSYEFCEISKRTFFTEHVWATASVPPAMIN